jgi:hypothetical protein
MIPVQVMTRGKPRVEKEKKKMIAVQKDNGQ